MGIVFAASSAAICFMATLADAAAASGGTIGGSGAAAVAGDGAVAGAEDEAPIRFTKIN